MTELTAREVEQLLLEHSDRFRDEFDWHDWNDLAGWNDKAPESEEVVGLGTVKVWNHDFGPIETNVSYLMFQIGDRVFRKEGLWVSHDGQYWDGFFREVKPVQRVITDYEEL